MPSYHRLPLAPSHEVPGGLAGQADDPDEVLAGDVRIDEEHGARRRDLMQIGDLAREAGRRFARSTSTRSSGFLRRRGDPRAGFDSMRATPSPHPLDRQAAGDGLQPR
jgi:hypothetical protein